MSRTKQTATHTTPPAHTDHGDVADHDQPDVVFAGGAIPPPGPVVGGGGTTHRASPSDLAYGPVADDAAASPVVGDRNQLQLDGFGTGETVTITNTGIDPIVIGSIYIDGDDYAFQLSPGVLGGTELAAGASFDLSVKQASRVAGSYQGAVVVQPYAGFMTVVPALRIPLTGTVAASTTVGTPIAATTPNGNANTIDSAMDSLNGEWSALLHEQIEGVGLVQAYAQHTAMASVSPIYSDLLQAALMLGVVGVTRQLAMRIGGRIARAVLDSGAARQSARGQADAQEVIATMAKVHEAMTSQVVDTLQGGIASAIRDGMVKAGATGATGATGKAAVARDSFFEAMKSNLNLGIADTKTATNNTTGDYQALEDRHAGLGFATLEAYRNEIATTAQTAKTEQIGKTLGLYGAYLAQPTTGVMGEGVDAETDLYGGGGISTNESNAAGEHFADGVLVIDMAWASMSIKGARMRGFNADLRALLSTAPLRTLGIPIMLAGNVLGTAGTTPRRGEVRVGRNERGSYYAAAADNQDDISDGTAYGWVFLEHAANGDFSERTSPSGKGRLLTLDEGETAAKNIFEQLDGVTLSDVEEG